MTLLWQTFLVWAGSASLMLLLWLAYLITQNPGIVDAGWVLGIWLGYVIYFSYSSSHSLVHWIVLALATLWMLRLGGFLFITRILPSHIDPRYLDVKNAFSRSESFNFFLNFQMQALLLLPIAVSGFYIFKQPGETSVLFWLGALIIVVGIIGEAVADQQLYTAKQQGFEGVFDQGLWAYSRHPNYFFEIITWCGFAIVGWALSGCGMPFVAPVALTFIMVGLTIPITERNSLGKRPETYGAYQARVPMLFPLKFW